jgi:hypothetical protein
VFARDTETGAEIARFCVLVKTDFCQDSFGAPSFWRFWDVPNEGALTNSVCFRRSFEQRGNARLPDRFGCVAHEGAPLMPRGVCLHFQEIRCKKSLVFRTPQLALSTASAVFVAPSSVFCLFKRILYYWLRCLGSAAGTRLSLANDDTPQLLKLPCACVRSTDTVQRSNFRCQ